MAGLFDDDRLADLVKEAGVFDRVLLVLGSFLHDLFRVPLFGESYTAFGRLNVGAVFIGMVLLGVGFAAMAVGMHRTPMRTRGAAGA